MLRNRVQPASLDDRRTLFNTSVSEPPLEGEGVTPDERIPYDREVLLRGEDPMLNAALRWFERVEWPSKE